jgi:hypothetical protein
MAGTIPRCRCGHTRDGHSEHSTRPCLACTACDEPGHDPHVAQRCTCPSFEPTCTICGGPLIGVDHAEVCAACAPVVIR